MTFWSDPENLTESGSDQKVRIRPDPDQQHGGEGKITSKLCLYVKSEIASEPYYFQ